MKALLLANNKSFYASVFQFLQTQMPTERITFQPPTRPDEATSRGSARRALAQIHSAVVLFREVMRAGERILLVCQSSHYAALIAASVARLFGRRVDVFLFNLLLRERMLNGIFGYIMRVLLKARVGIYVNAPNEIDILRRLSPSIYIHYYPYCHEDLLGVTAADSTLGDFIFSGGNTNRDFDTLFRAAVLLPEMHFIVIRPTMSISTVAVPSNVECLEGVAIEEFHRTMASARVVVVPLASSVGASGQMVALSAMILGKAVVYTNYGSLSQYFEDGITGFAFEAGDAASLATAIRRADSCVEEAGGVGTAAQLAATTRFSRANYDQELLVGLRDFIHGSSKDT